MKVEGIGPSTIAKTLKIGRALVYRALADYAASKYASPACPPGGKNFDF
jgi:hypothetical protein